MRIGRLSALLAVALILVSQSASADTILYSTVGSAFGSDGWQTHADPEQQISVAMPFTIGGSMPATIRTIELGFSFDPTGEDFVQVDVFEPADGHPGLSRFALSYDLPFFSTPDRLLTLTTQIRLAPGSYFLGLRTTGDIVGTWSATNAPFVGGWTSVNDGPWIEQPGRQQGVFRLSGTQAPEIPEPASLIFIGSGLGALWLSRRSRPGSELQP